MIPDYEMVDPNDDDERRNAEGHADGPDLPEFVAGLDPDARRRWNRERVRVDDERAENVEAGGKIEGDGPILSSIDLEMVFKMDTTDAGLLLGGGTAGGLPEADHLQVRHPDGDFVTVNGGSALVATGDGSVAHVRTDSLRLYAPAPCHIGISEGKILALRSTQRPACWFPLADRGEQIIDHRRILRPGAEVGTQTIAVLV